MSLDHFSISALMVMMSKFGEPDFHEFIHGVGHSGPVVSGSYIMFCIGLLDGFGPQTSIPNMSPKSLGLGSHYGVTTYTNSMSCGICLHNSPFCEV